MAAKIWICRFSRYNRTMKKPFVLNRLLHISNESHQKDTNYSIAKTLCDHFYELPSMTIQETADLCYVSCASISRFVRYLGYSGFSEFKESCAKSIGIEADYSNEVKKAQKEDLLPIYTRFTEQILSNIQIAFSELDIEQMDRICGWMQKADKIAVLGLEFSSLVGEHIQSRLMRMHKNVQTSLDFQEQKEIVQNLTNNSLIFILSMEAGYLYHNPEIIDLIQAKGCKVVIITINPYNKQMQFADKILMCGKQNYNTEGRISLLYMVELLLMHYSISYFQNLKMNRPS